jgi:preprotein translocase subunit SecA
MVRADHNDQIYKTKGGKWKAVLREIAERNERGQPILIGTISVEVSEMLGEEFKRNGIEHVVLNAKPEHAAREGETISQAGRIGSVTIATNMAGRGVDIKLGGDPEAMARAELKKKGLEPGADGYDAAFAEILPGLEEQCQAEGDKVRELGGLFICGTERHESRRIDNQLRGRSGRQGDPGESRFFLSAEDDLVRLFAGDRIYKILDRLGPVDEEGEEYPLEAKLLTKQIEGAQKKVEQQNFLIRKRVLEYDDVMNEQRRIIYKYRREILEGRDMSDVAYEEVGQVAVRLTEEFTQGDIFEEWDIGGLRAQAESIWGGGSGLEGLDPNTSSREDIGEMLSEEALTAYEKREHEVGEELTRWLERQILLQIIDNRWREHLYEMDYLREGIHLRGFAQIDPLVAYKNEGYSMFEELMASIWQEFARVIFHVEVNVEAPPEQPRPAARGPQEVNYSGGTPDGQPSALQDAAAAAATGAPAAAGAATAAEEAPPEQARPQAPTGTVVKSENEKLGRNDPCWCGSGKKFKNCHGR